MSDKGESRDPLLEEFDRRRMMAMHEPEDSLIHEFRTPAGATTPDDGTDAFLQAAEVFKSPHAVIEGELAEILSFVINHFPTEAESHEEPPIRFSTKTDLFPIDGLLGQYSPHEQRITIFCKGIERVSEALAVKPTDLTFVVRLHEWAHALIHLGVSKSEGLNVGRDELGWLSHLDAATTAFNSIERGVHERIAQLLTLYGIRTLQLGAKMSESRAALERIEDVFHLVSRRQPVEYRVEKFEALPKSRIVQSIALLRKGWLSGSVKAWTTVVTW